MVLKASLLDNKLQIFDTLIVYRSFLERRFTLSNLSFEVEES